MVFITILSLRWLCEGQKYKIARFARHFKLFAFFYRFFLEGSLDICLSVAITFSMMNANYWNSFGMFISSTLCVANCLILAGMVIITIKMSLYYQKNYKTDTIYRRRHRWMFGELEGKKLICALYHVFFILRRYFLVVCLIAFPSKYGLQIFFTVHGSLFFLLYLSHSTPFIDSKTDRMELFNEAVVWLASYFLYPFTPWGPDT